MKNSACGALLLSVGLAIPISCFAQSAPPSPSPAATPDLAVAIRTPAAPASPRINGPRVYGAHPAHPFFYHVPVTGVRPITVAAVGLPPGLTLDGATGNITGVVAAAGEHKVTFTAVNQAGKDTATLRIVIGPTICLTPPLGWNSWNCFTSGIDEKKIRGAADAMVATGLIDHGWAYINMDDNWEGERDAAGNIQSNKTRFPDLKSLSRYIHGKGLKFGIYSVPGPVTCANALGSYLHVDQDAATYAGWDMDYLKYDWCSYEGLAALERASKYGPFLSEDKARELETLCGRVAVLGELRYGHHPAFPQTDAIKAAVADAVNYHTKPEIEAQLKIVQESANKLMDEARKADPAKTAGIELEILRGPYVKMRASLNKVDRDVVFSFCQIGRGKVWEWGAAAGGNLWRTNRDIQPNWKSVEDHGFSQNGLEAFAGPGHWNDPDMLEVGNGHLTPDENYTHMTLWCMLASPLLIGCDMPKMSSFIVSLFTNDEVLAVNQDELGKQGYRARQEGQQEVWIKPLADGSLAVALFNRADAAADVSARWSDLKLTGRQTVRDLWRQRDLGVQPDGYTVSIAPHGAELFKVAPVK